MYYVLVCFVSYSPKLCKLRAKKGRGLEESSWSMHALVPHLAIAVPLQHERSTLLVSSDDVSSRALTPFAFADGNPTLEFTSTGGERRLLDRTAIWLHVLGL